MSTPDYSYSINIEALTVEHTDRYGETWDLNAKGEPCKNVGELRDFIRELYHQGFYDVETRDYLFSQLL